MNYTNKELKALIKRQNRRIKLLRKLQRLGFSPKDKPLRMYIFTEENELHQYELKLKAIRNDKQ